MVFHYYQRITRIIRPLSFVFMTIELEDGPTWTVEAWLEENVGISIPSESGFLCTSMKSRWGYIFT